jgi:hypothetical protein
MEHQAVTTINIGIYQDGTIEQSSLEMMRQLRRAIRAAKPSDHAAVSNEHSGK